MMMIMMMMMMMMMMKIKMVGPGADDDRQQFSRPSIQLILIS
jgi:hypothetical protein